MFFVRISEVQSVAFYIFKGGIRQVDEQTVAFELDAPNSNFPFYVSSDVVNAIILPADYNGDFEKTFIGTGPFKLESFRPKQGATFVRNPDYWASRLCPTRWKSSSSTTRRRNCWRCKPANWT